MQKELLNVRYYGMYRAKVVENDETQIPSGDAGTTPKKWGRIKVRVYPMMAAESIKMEALPWAVPAFPLKEGAGDGFGVFSIPRKEAMVWVFFEDGDPMCPVYFAEAPDGTHGLPAWMTVNYPDRKGVEFENGMRVWVDESDDKVWIEHPSGTYIQISSSGAVDVVTQDKITINAVASDISIKADVGKIDVEATVDKITVNAKASDVVVKADLGNVNVEATAGIVTVKGGMGVQINP